MHERLLDRQRLSDIATGAARAYRLAAPFPHGVHDALLSSEFLDHVHGEFPPLEDPIWRSRQHENSDKFESAREDELGPWTQRALAELNSGLFIQFLERLTGIEALLPDPYFRGGGLHQSPPGGRLEVHADFNWHERLGLHRRVNVLVYLNKGWREDYGGHLELWGEEMTEPQVRILPVFNRMVVFTTTDTSFHGHPHPLTCPTGQSRKSIALYYYTARAPQEGATRPHSTIYRGNRGLTAVTSGLTFLRRLVKSLTPPILISGLRWLGGSRRRRP